MASAMLRAILALCGDMKELQTPSARLHGRLARVLAALETQEAARRLPPTDALARFALALRRTRDFLRRHRARPLFARVVGLEKTMHGLRELNAEVDALQVELELELESKTEPSAWLAKWRKDLAAAMRALEATVDSGELFGDARADVEALTVLKYEMQQQRDRHCEGMLVVMEKLYDQLMSAAGLDMEVEVPGWFVARDEVEYDRSPFAKGSFGAVYRGTWKNGERVVVKTVVVDDAAVSDGRRDQMVRELDVWYKLDHPNVLKMVAACHVGSPILIVCEEASQGNVLKFLGSSGTSQKQEKETTELWRVIYEAALGLEYLHTSGVIHGELMASNILVGSAGIAKISDFGLSVTRSMPSTASSPSRAGRLRWRAPECLKRRASTASDVYALAMCIIEAASGEPPFACVDDDTVYRLLRDGEIPEKPDVLDAEAWELIKFMTHRDPLQRMPLADVIASLKLLGDASGEVDPGLKVLDEEETEEDLFDMVDSSGYFSTPEPTSYEEVRQADVVLSADHAPHTVCTDSSPVEDLVAALIGGPLHCHGSVVHCLYRVCKTTSSHEALGSSGVIPKLVDIAASQSVDLEARLFALTCVRQVTSSVDADEIDSIDSIGRRIPIISSALLIERLSLTDSHDAEDIVRALDYTTCVIEQSDEAKKSIATSELLSIILQRLANTTERVSRAAADTLITAARAGLFDVDTLESTRLVPTLVGLLSQDSTRSLYELLLVLTDLCEFCPEAVPALLKANTIERLTTLVGCEEETITMLAAKALGLLCETQTLAKTLNLSAAADALMKLTNSEVIELRIQAVVALGRMCVVNKKARSHAAEPRVIETFVELFPTASKSEKSIILRTLRDLSEDTLTCQTLEKAGAVELLVGMLESATSENAALATSTLSMLTEASSDSIIAVHEAQAAKNLLNFLHHDREDLRVVCCRVLCNLVLYPPARIALEASLEVDSVAAVLRCGSDEEQCEVGLLLGRLCQHSDKICEDLKRARGINPLIQMLTWTSQESRVRLLHGAILSGCYALAHAGVLDSAILLDSAVVSLLLVKISIKNGRERCQAIRALSAICECVVESRERIVEENGLDVISDCLSTEEDDLRIPAAHILAYMANPVYASTFVNTRGVIEVLERLILHSSINCQREATFALCSFCVSHSAALETANNPSVLTVMINLLLNGRAEEVTFAVRALACFDASFWLRRSKEGLDAARSLVRLLWNGSQEQKLPALFTLVAMTSYGCECNKIIVELNGINAICASLEEHHIEEERGAAMELLGNLVLFIPMCDLCGVVESVMDIFCRGTMSLRLSSVKLLKKICTYKVEARKFVEQLDGIEPLIHCLHWEDDISIRFECVRLLCCLVESEDTRSVACERGAVEVLLESLVSGEILPEVLKRLMDIASDHQQQWRLLQAGIVEQLERLLANGTDTQKLDALLLLKTLRLDEQTHSELAPRSSFEQLIKLIEFGAHEHKLRAAEIVFDVIADEPQMVKTKDCLAIVGLYRMGCDTSRDVATQILERLSCVEPHCFHIVRAGAIPHLVDCLGTRSSSAKQASETITRLARFYWDVDRDDSFPEQLLEFVEMGLETLSSRACRLLLTIGGNEGEYKLASTGLIDELLNIVLVQDHSDRKIALKAIEALASSCAGVALIGNSRVVSKLVESAEESPELSSQEISILHQISKSEQGCGCLVRVVDLPTLLRIGFSQSWARCALCYTFKEPWELSLITIADHVASENTSERLRKSVLNAWHCLASNEIEAIDAEITNLVRNVIEDARQSRDDEHRRNALLVLCKLSHCEKFREKIAISGGMGPIVELFSQSNDDTTILIAANSLVVLVKDNEAIHTELVNRGCIGRLIEMARVGDRSEQNAAAALLANVASNPVAARAIKTLGGDEALEKLTMETDPLLRAHSRQALRALKEHNGATIVPMLDADKEHEKCMVEMESSDVQEDSPATGDSFDPQDTRDDGEDEDSYSESYDSDNEPIIL